ncbi:MAG: hypothetical protein ACI9SC_001276, partial [Gammaproteobacteria bacterium]
MRNNEGHNANFSRARLYCAVLVIITLSLIIPDAPLADVSSPPNISSVWSNALLTPEDERWRLVDIACARTGCSLTGFTYLQALLEDKNNDHRSIKELFFDMREYEKKQNENLLTPLGQKKQAEYHPSQGAALDCTPEGDNLRHQILAPVPMQIEQLEDRVIIRYEYWNAVRTIYLDGRAYPEGEPPTRLGHSVGRYEGSTMIVETTHVIPNVTGVPGGGAFAPSSETIFIERYTHNPDNGRLDLELSIIDPVHFKK